MAGMSTVNVICSYLTLIVCLFRARVCFMVNFVLKFNGTFLMCLS